MADDKAMINVDVNISKALKQIQNLEKSIQGLATKVDLSLASGTGPRKKRPPKLTEEEKQKREEEKKRKAEEKQRLKEEAAKKKAEEKQKKAEEKQRLKEEAARKKKEETEAKRKAEEEERKKKESENKGFLNSMKKIFDGNAKNIKGLLQTTSIDASVLGNVGRATFKALGSKLGMPALLAGLGGVAMYKKAQDNFSAISNLKALDIAPRTFEQLDKLLKMQGSDTGAAITAIMKGRQLRETLRYGEIPQDLAMDIAQKSGRGKVRDVFSSFQNAKTDIDLIKAMINLAQSAKDQRGAAELLNKVIGDVGATNLFTRTTPSQFQKDFAAEYKNYGSLGDKDVREAARKTHEVSIAVSSAHNSAISQSTAAFNSLINTVKSLNKELSSINSGSATPSTLPVRGKP
jgi:hypothetical protein